MNFKIWFMVGLALFFTACSTGMNYAPNMEKQYGFRVNEGESEKVSNPSSENLTRIYFYRTNSILGLVIKYRVVYSSGEFNKESIKQSPLIFYATRGEYSYKDIEVKEGEALNFFAETEKDTLVTFYPKANQIYCFETAIVPGLLVGRASIELVDKQRCLEEIKDKTFQNLEELPQKLRKTE